MKNFKFLGIICLLVAGLMFVSCTSEPIPGPQGLAGIDGVDGQNGQNGQDGTDGEATCVACHSESHRAPINASYDLSGHAAGGAVGYAGGRSSCTYCHSNEGFIDWMEGMPAVNRTDQTPISCTACHSKHSTFDFENDGHDYAVRNYDPVTLMTDASVTIDYGDLSNLCANCHQPRRTEPINDGNDEFTVTSSHWGPHYGFQVALLEGIQGAHIVGSVAYPTPQSATHRTGASCTSCHMAETTDGTDGAHTWNTSINGCNNCHSNTPTTVAGLDDDIATLKTLLESVVGWEYVYEEDANGDLVEDANGDPIMVLDGNGDPVTREVIGVLVDGAPNNGTQGQGATFPFKAAQAGWNYRVLYQDHSHGIHNPAYARALVQNSIEALQ